jgi:hypothetical protein
MDRIIASALLVATIIAGSVAQNHNASTCQSNQGFNASITSQIPALRVNGTQPSLRDDQFANDFSVITDPSKTWQLTMRI